MKSAYVRLVHGLAVPLDRMGVLGHWERAPRGSARFWLRTQFAIYDAVDLIRLDLPWWTYGAIRAVESWLAERGGRVDAFEYGSGASTAWLARRCRQVVSIEHDAAFASMLAPLLPRDGVTLRVVEPEPAADVPLAPSGRRGYERFDFDRYVRAIAEPARRYDLIVVDGRARSACLHRAREALAPGGLLVFDNSSRKRYQAALARYAAATTRHRGWAPALPIRSETALIRG
jgi:predicted O-methyltransferase YrrM